MKNSIAYEDSLRKIEYGNWSKMYFHEKIDTLQAIENEMAKRQGRAPCPIKASALTSNYFEVGGGLYETGSKEIHVNSIQLTHNSIYGKNPEFHLKSVLHEGRHAYQDQVVKGNIAHHNPEEVELWKENLKEGNYIKSHQNPRGYYYQPVEVDARRFSEDMIKQLHRERSTLSNVKNSNAAAKSSFIKQMNEINTHVEDTRKHNSEHIKKQYSSINSNNIKQVKRDKDLSGALPAFKAEPKGNLPSSNYSNTEKQIRKSIDRGK